MKKHDDEQCPACGYCPHCGRSNAPVKTLPYPVPYPVPAPRPVYPWTPGYPHYYTGDPLPFDRSTITCNGASTVIASTTGQAML